MTLLQGRNGRVYKDGKLVESTHHPETRTPEELRAARIAQQPRQPSGDVSNINPFKGRFESRGQRRGQLWAKSPEGQEYKLEMAEAAEAWDRERADAQTAADFATSVEPMVQHAQRTLAEAEADNTVTVAELEQLRSNAQLAREGRADEYKAADRAWRDVQRTKLEEKAHGHDSIIRQHQAERDSILANAWGRESDPVPEVRQPDPMNIPVDRSRVAITRKVQTEHGVREVTTFEDV